MHQTNFTPRVFSGIQPSGGLTLGNYLGALKRFVTMQDQGTHETIFCMVDLHAITVWQDPDTLRRNTRELCAGFIASGVDPEKSILFNQSAVPEHAQLAWIFNCVARMGWLNRMTQFKEKAGKNRENASLGLYAYPSLMAADILVYKATHVPVGEDQKQHLELARDLATRFNHYHGDIFTIPAPNIPKQGARIMSLQDPNKKMSKSDDNENSLIRMLDPPEVIAKKLKRSVTDSENTIAYNPEQQPGVANLLTLLAIASDQSIDQCLAQLSGQGYGALKAQTADAIVTMLAPIQSRYQGIRDDEQALHSILQDGAAKAQVRAAKTLKKAQEALGLITL